MFTYTNNEIRAERRFFNEINQDDLKVQNKDKQIFFFKMLFLRANVILSRYNKLKGSSYVYSQWFVFFSFPRVEILTLLLTYFTPALSNINTYYKLY